MTNSHFFKPILSTLSSEHIFVQSLHLSCCISSTVQFQAAVKVEQQTKAAAFAYQIVIMLIVCSRKAAREGQSCRSAPHCDSLHQPDQHHPLISMHGHTCGELSGLCTPTVCRLLRSSWKGKSRRIGSHHVSVHQPDQHHPLITYQW